jgi:hypothetical protein
MDEARGYALTNEANLRVPATAPLPAGSYAPSIATQSYFEYVLQVLDKNSLLTSVVFIDAYAGIMHCL